jgi:hypothetical protein
MKLKLPHNYKKLISEYNGGYPVKEYFKGGMVYFLPIKYGEYTLDMNIKNTRDYFPKISFRLRNMPEHHYAYHLKMEKILREFIGLMKAVKPN